MIDAIGQSQVAMQLDQLKLQSINQNIANMNTPGYKKEQVEHAYFEGYLQPSTNATIQELQKNHNSTQGTFIQTNNPTDMALSGDGYFQVQGEEGVFYTRRGDFTVSNRGELITATGQTVLGASGPIQIDDSQFSIDAQGSLFIDHHKVDQLKIAHFKQADLMNYVGNGLYQTDESPSPSDGTTKVQQGFIEQSNVKSIDEMMDMVKTSRHFQASQHVMRAADNLLATAINQLGEGNV